MRVKRTARRLGEGPPPLRGRRSDRVGLPVRVRCPRPMAARALQLPGAESDGEMEGLPETEIGFVGTATMAESGAEADEGIGVPERRVPPERRRRFVAGDGVVRRRRLEGEVARSYGRRGRRRGARGVRFRHDRPVAGEVGRHGGPLRPLVLQHLGHAAVHLGAAGTRRGGRVRPAARGRAREQAACGRLAHEPGHDAVVGGVDETKAFQPGGGGGGREVELPPEDGAVREQLGGIGREREEPACQRLSHALGHALRAGIGATTTPASVRRRRPESTSCTVISSEKKGLPSVASSTDETSASAGVAPMRSATGRRGRAARGRRAGRACSTWQPGR